MENTHRCCIAVVHKNLLKKNKRRKRRETTAHRATMNLDRDSEKGRFDSDIAVPFSITISGTADCFNEIL